MFLAKKEEFQLIENDEFERSYLYISSSLKKSKACQELYKKSFVLKDLQTAKRFLSQRFLEKGFIPELIILDIPYNKQAHSDFIAWIKNYFNYYKIPVIYNKASISFYQIKELKILNQIDEVVKLEHYCKGLSEKNNFLKKVNSFLDRPLRSDKILNELHNRKVKRPKEAVIKRTIDIAIAIIAIIFFIPLFVLIAIAIKMESWNKCPIIYSSLRVGSRFRIFKFYKFRTMIPDADKQLSKLSGLNIYESKNNEGPRFFKVANDPRITKVGSFLRKSSLDELPQLFNVLKGDMSIVGNRPLPLYEAESLITDECIERFIAPAGITGLWQVSKRGKENMSSDERVSLDIDYARNQTLKGDFLILMKTPTAFIQKTNV